MLVGRVPAYFSAVGQFYTMFGQTEDEEVIAILQAEAERRKQKAETAGDN
jgi:predicted phosphoribosyltransferase